MIKSVRKGARKGFLFDERGEGRGSAIFWTLFLILALYGSIKFAPMYFKYLMMIYEVSAEVKSADKFNDFTMRKHILEKADTWSLPITKEDILISRSYNDITVIVNYDIEKSFFIKYKRVFIFRIDDSGPLKDEYR